jgi:hypothetical protein
LDVSIEGRSCRVREIESRLARPIPDGHRNFDEYLGLKDTRDNRRDAERIKRGLDEIRYDPLAIFRDA